jgi:biopolymer transport protein ExbB/TolQ
MVAIEVFLTVIVLALVLLLLVAGAAMLLGKRFRLDEWFRRDRRRLELLREQEQREQEAREAARRELEHEKEASEPQVIRQRHDEETE